jgi:hypothetical protein
MSALNVYDEDRFACPRSGDCSSAVVKDYLDGTFKGPPPEKVALQTEILLGSKFSITAGLVCDRQI